ncbi:MAG TPA: DegT/DnrJ/EryC1/StrS family aminotransferase [Desulfuromonadales bacterium]|nr:DegT/DnrJ/EryC1/StrS family aminotransferase [Desulfuromonadales bacterium]
MMQIPMVDLKIQYRQLKSEIDAAISKVLDSAHFVLGPEGTAFEQEIAVYLGVKHAVGVASGTDALHLALRAAGLGPGDEVITSPFTFIATAEAIAYVGAKPVFVDIEPDTFNIDVDRVAAAITPATRAILPVHLFGQPADLQPLAQICREHDLLLIEDCAQSCGARYGEKMTGSHGDQGCFSFFPSKNLGGFGDGGLVVTNRDDLAAEIRVLRSHGSRERYHHSLIGYNSRLDDLQAAILRVKLQHLDQFNARRRENAHRYSELLGELGIEVPYEDGKGTHVYHQFTILSDQRERLQKALFEAGVASAVYYPIPLHRQDVFLDICGNLAMPVSEQTARRVLSLPIFPELSEEQIQRVTGVIRAAL